MSVHVIEYKDGAKVMRPILSYKEYAALRNSMHNRDMTRQARNGNANAKRRMIQFNYSCMPNEGMLKGATVESNSVGMDVDFQVGMDKLELERQLEIVKNNIIAKAEELGLLMLERSATKGLHAVFRRRTGMTQEENLKWAAKTLGVEYDAQAKDITRVFFTPTADAGDLFFCKDELFINEAAEKATTAAGTAEAAGTATKSPSTVAGLTAEGTAEGTTATAEGTAEGDTIYFGYNFTKIIAKYWELYNGGKEPTVGNRNALIFDLARSLRSICDYSIDMLKMVIPRYADLPEAEYEQCLKNALDEPRKGINFKLQKVLNLLNEEQAADKRQLETIEPLDSKTPPKMPLVLPWPLGELSSQAPDYYRPAVCDNVFVPMSVNMHEVTFTYWDNVVHEATFMNVLAAGMSIGKGCINVPCRMIVANVSESDKVAREREEEYKLKNPQGATSIEARPKDICIQVLIDNLTDAVFNQRVYDADRNGQRYLYTSVDELDTLKKITSRGTASEVSVIIRKAFDNSKHGQERVGSDSVTGIAPLRFNFNASTTNRNFQQFFAREMTTGTVTRLSLATIIKPIDAQRPVFKEYDSAYIEEVRKLTQRLSSFSGEIDCPKCNEFAVHLCDENEKLAALYGSDSYLTLSYRATVIAWLKGMMLYIMNGEKWTKEIQDYMEWSLRYDLWVKMLVIGKMLDVAMGEEVNATSNRGPKNMLLLLKDEFKIEDLIILRKRMNKSVDLKTIKTQLCMWRARKLVDFESYNDIIRQIKKQ